MRGVEGNAKEKKKKREKKKKKKIYIYKQNSEKYVQ